MPTFFQSYLSMSTSDTTIRLPNNTSRSTAVDSRSIEMIRSRLYSTNVKGKCYVNGRAIYCPESSRPYFTDLFKTKNQSISNGQPIFGPRLSRPSGASWWFVASWLLYPESDRLHSYGRADQSTTVYPIGGPKLGQNRADGRLFARHRRRLPTLVGPWQLEITLVGPTLVAVDRLPK